MVSPSSGGPPGVPGEWDMTPPGVIGSVWCVVPGHESQPGVVFAGITNVDQLWAVANISVAASALPNLVALLLLSGVFLTLMRDFLSGENAWATAKTDRTRSYIRTAN